MVVEVRVGGNPTPSSLVGCPTVYACGPVTPLPSSRFRSGRDLRPSGPGPGLLLPDGLKSPRLVEEIPSTSRRKDFYGLSPLYLWSVNSYASLLLVSGSLLCVSIGSSTRPRRKWSTLRPPWTSLPLPSPPTSSPTSWESVSLRTSGTSPCTGPVGKRGTPGSASDADGPQDGSTPPSLRPTRDFHSYPSGEGPGVWSRPSRLLPRERGRGVLSEWSGRDGAGRSRVSNSENYK